jgi:hypothetical protein
MKFNVIDLQTSKVLTTGDLERIALTEQWAKDLMHCDMEQFAVGEDGTLYLLDECGKYESCPAGRFEVYHVTGS